MHFEDETLLQCPVCATENGVHIDQVTAMDSRGHRITVWARGEDDRGRLTLQIPGEPIMTGGSSRRHSFTLHIWCEMCHRIASVTLAQHKGDTNIQVWTQPVQPRIHPEIAVT